MRYVTALLSKKMEQRHIVLVDNENDFVNTNAMLLRLHGFRVSCYYDAPTALKAIKDEAPDVVVMDIAMPPIDGYEACRQLRAEPWGTNIPAIALSGFGRDIDVQRAIEAGFDEHLLKPAEIEQLICIS